MTGNACTKLTCPRCGVSFEPVRGKLPLHTRPVQGMQRNGLYQETQAKVCE